MFTFCMIQSCWTCTRHVSKRCTLINVINKCCTLFVFFLYGFLVLLRQGLHVVTLLGLPLRCRESGFRPRKSGSFQLSHIASFLCDFSHTMLCKNKCMKLNMSATYMTSMSEKRKDKLPCQVWTLDKLVHGEPFNMPWAKQENHWLKQDPYSPLSHQVRQGPNHVHMQMQTIWQALHDVERINHI
jgi:hypothetical protein